MLGLRHPFFRQRWRRVATTIVLAGWSGFEFYMDNGVWAMIFVAITLVCFYEFFIVYDPKNYQDKNADDGQS